MATDLTRSFQMPRREELGLFTISNGSGLSIAALPNGTLFAIEYADDKGSVQINQIQGSPLTGGIGRLYLRIGGATPDVVEIVGPRADGSFGHDATSFSWSGIRVLTMVLIHLPRAFSIVDPVGLKPLGRNASSRSAAAPRDKPTNGSTSLGFAPNPVRRTRCRASGSSRIVLSSPICPPLRGAS